MLKRAKDVIASGDLGQVVDFAIDLNRQKVDIEKELEDLKVYLRDEAKKKGTASAELDGLTGTIEVVFPGLQFKMKKGSDLRDLEANLPREVFAKLFRRTIEIIPALDPDDFENALGALSPDQRATIGHFVEITSQTGKVYVPR